MSALGLIVFMTKEEVITRYRIPEHLLERLLANMPVATTRNGAPVYLESQVDAFLRNRFPYPPTVAPYQNVQGGRPRGGRKVATAHEAEYALTLKRQDKTMKEIVAALKDKFPSRKQFFSTDSVRKTMERHEKRRRRETTNDIGINPLNPR